MTKVVSKLMPIIFFIIGIKLETTILLVSIKKTDGYQWDFILLISN